MTQDDVLEMARQANLGVTLTHSGDVGQFIEGSNWTEEIEAFAKLVEAKAKAEEREHIIQMMPGGSSVDPQWVCDQIRARGEK